MPNVVTPFIRKRDKTTRTTPATARHRREGWFDEQDRWHDAELEATSTGEAAR